MSDGEGEGGNVGERLGREGENSGVWEGVGVAEGVGRGGGW